ncbi:hypothetical protein OsI_38608 [Oryza sativa Indica Group]|uniref:Uncharacterized protein n=1 Tax=Oryza sativa subsp. indica TaxID=39946 RepID=A2ZLA9_ORYSI|nr:hypothetical protein OsI_38608 [Oryza sativa Indica Group]
MAVEAGKTMEAALGKEATAATDHVAAEFVGRSAWRRTVLLFSLQPPPSLMPALSPPSLLDGSGNGARSNGRRQWW